MAKTKAEIEAIARQYVDNLRACQVHVERVILFGSYGRGTPTDRSDMDLAFVSKDFDHYNLLQRQTILASCRPGLVRTDVLGYSPAMLERKRDQSPLVRQILSEGITVYPAA